MLYQLLFSLTLYPVFIFLSILPCCRFPYTLPIFIFLTLSPVFVFPYTLPRFYFPLHSPSLFPLQSPTLLLLSAETNAYICKHDLLFCLIVAFLKSSWKDIRKSRSSEDFIESGEYLKSKKNLALFGSSVVSSRVDRRHEDLYA